MAAAGPQNGYFPEKQPNAFAKQQPQTSRPTPNRDENWPQPRHCHSASSPLRKQIGAGRSGQIAVFEKRQADKHSDRAIEKTIAARTKEIRDRDSRVGGHGSFALEVVEHRQHGGK